MTPRSPAGPGLYRALDEARFGRSRTLDLRRDLPTAADAEARADAWLRERQVTISGEVLIITGRGRGSDGGIAVVRPTIVQRLSRLKRQGVVSEVHEHTPGSFVVTLAPVRAMLSAPARSKDRPPQRRAKKADGTPWGLRPATTAALRTLAIRSLDALGIRTTDALVEDEMRHHLARLSGAVGDGPDRDVRLRTAIDTAVRELSDE